MMRPARVLKPLAWIAALAVGLPVAGYLALVLVNLRDQPPAPEALAYARLKSRWSPLADADNAWVFALGLSTRPGADPARDGARRAAWIRQQLATPLFDPSGDPLVDAGDSQGSGATADLSRTCNQGNSDCLLALQRDPVVLRDWLQQQDWLLQRYQQLLRHQHWQEPRPWDFLAPLPGYSAVVEGQKLQLASALLQAREGRPEAAQALLEADARFWLMVAADTDLLITRMVAASAIKRNMGWSALVSRELPRDRMQEVLPPAWRQPLPQSVCSLRQVMAGEWAGADRLVRKMDMGWREAEFLREPASAVWRERIQQALQQPLWQEQDTSNDIARHHQAFGRIFDTDCAGVGAALARWSQHTAGLPARSAWSLLYNPVYRINNDSAPDWSEYAARLGDLETMRRALLATVALREAGTAPAGVATALMNLPLRDPLDGGPLLWDDAAGAITFRALAEDRQGWYRFPY